MGQGTRAGKPLAAGSDPDETSPRAVFGLAESLWPRAVISDRRHPPKGARRVADYLPIPSAADPRLLIPRGHRRSAAAALWRQPGRSVKQRIRRNAAAFGVAAGFAAIAPRGIVGVDSAEPQEDTIESYFNRLFGFPVVLSLHLGKPRANRKPVVQVLTPRGGTVGFAKVGVDSLTNALVRNEAAALALIGQRRYQHLTASTVLSMGRWNTAEILVMSSLPVWRRQRALPANRLLSAGREVAATVPLRRLALRDWLRESGRLDDLHQLADTPAARRLGFVITTLLDDWGDRPLVCGFWHGDWTPWNMAYVKGDLYVWDWERFSAPAPVGFDALHYALQEALVIRRHPPQAAVRLLIVRSPALLAAYDVNADTVCTVTAAYLCELAVRYLKDAQAEAGARLGRVEEWLIPELETLVGTL